MKRGLLKRGLVPVVLLLGAARTGATADLSPPLDKPPTVETEIKRGMDAESACSPTLAVPDYGHCIFGIEARNRQSMLDYNPFDIGLFFRAWVAMDALANPSRPADSDAAQRLSALASHQAASMYTIYRAYQKKVGVTDEFVIALSGLSPSTLESRIAFWDAQPP
jgi:hypothetical protein